MSGPRGVGKFGLCKPVGSVLVKRAKNRKRGEKTIRDLPSLEIGTEEKKEGEIGKEATTRSLR